MGLLIRGKGGEGKGVEGRVGGKGKGEGEGRDRGKGMDGGELEGEWGSPMYPLFSA